MNFGEILSSLLIGPLQMLFEVIFAVINRMVHNPGVTIIFLSLVVNFLVMPLYKRADEMQEEQRQKEAELKHWTKHIKKTFSGDERFMMLQTYYRQNNYKPTDALKGTVSLLLEVPFFMAAYAFLSHLQILQGFKFGPIANLGAPDALLQINGVAINVLPILMTVINIISGAIYTKGFPVKAKVQLYGMALLFLVLLYDSPAGLVFYWTLNNVFSLAKNIFYKLKHPKLVLEILSALSGATIVVLAWVLQPEVTIKRRVLESLIGVTLVLPLLAHGLSRCRKKPLTRKVKELERGEKTLFYFGVLFLAILIGFVIPLSVIKASPEEFIDSHFIESPLIYVVNAACLAFGLFVIWGLIFYSLATAATKRLMGVLVWLAAVIAVVNFAGFSSGFGGITNALRYNLDLVPQLTLQKRLVNAGVLLAVGVIAYLLYRYQKRLVRAIYIVMGLAMLVTGAMDVKAVHETIQNSALMLAKKDEPAITMSTKGKNVMVIMMDRASSMMLPFIFNEKPEVAQQFAGFTYYPNTISYGGYTNVGTPVLYGGYDYKPTKMNQRSDELMKDKQNEALMVMPVNFMNAGAKVNVGDPTYANYGWVPDLSIYDKYPEINKFRSMGAFDAAPELSFANMRRTLMHNLVQYSMMQASPLAVWEFIYNNGEYNDPNAEVARMVTEDSTDEERLFASSGQTTRGASVAEGMDAWYMSSLYALKNYAGFTYVNQDEGLNFTMISNDMTHQPVLLQEPSYTPAPEVDNTEYDAAHRERFDLGKQKLKMETGYQMSHYHVNMAAAMQLGNYFDYLREHEVFDNTRIVITSDHGVCLGEMPEWQTTPDYHPGNNVQCEQALLLVKDFGAQEFQTNTEFMTIGDVPYLAMKDIVANPVNPASGNPIDMSGKAGRQQIVFTDWHALPGDYQLKPGDWYSVEDNIFDMSNWGYEGHGLMPRE